jgi:probable addiction module antidote protein
MANFSSLVSRSGRPAWPNMVRRRGPPSQGSDAPSFIAAAIGDLAKARGVSKFSRETGLSREPIYKTFRVGGNPTLDTLSEATGVLGYKLTLVRKNRIVGSSTIGHLSGKRATAAKAKKRA